MVFSPGSQIQDIFHFIALSIKRGVLIFHLVDFEKTAKILLLSLFSDNNKNLVKIQNVVNDA